MTVTTNCLFPEREDNGGTNIDQQELELEVEEFLKLCSSYGYGYNTGYNNYNTGYSQPYYGYNYYQPSYQVTRAVTKQPKTTEQSKLTRS